MDENDLTRWFGQYLETFAACGRGQSGYDRTEVLDSEVRILNSSAGLYRGEFSRRRADESEISRLTASYLVTDGPSGHRISALIVHSR